MSDPYDDRTFMEKYGLAVLAVVIVLLLGGVGLGFYFFKGSIPPPKKPDEIMVRLLPPPLPPPPPPPPKTPPPPKEQPKMVELKPQDKTPPKPTPSPAPPGPPGPKATGAPSDDGIGNNGGGGYGIGGDGSGSVFGYYASQVGDQVRAALGRNAKTRNASFHVKVRIWFDATGRITRARLSNSTGDPAIDSAIKDEVLATLQLAPPPQGMPPTIAMNLTEVRPN